MAKIVCGTILILLFFQAYSQKASYTHSSVLGVHFCLNDFKNSSFFGRLKKDAGLSISYLKGLNSRFDWQLSISGSFPDSTSKEPASTGKKSIFLQSDFSFRTRLFAKSSVFQPYLLTGVGASHYKESFGAFSLIGSGIEFNYKDVFFLINAQYRFSLTNTLNNHYYYSLGIAGLLTKPQKKKPVAAPVIQQKVSRDRDGDGIVDSLDACPDQPGLARFNGCPDRDGDGIPDKEDSCPDFFGLERYKGCPVPDKDGDGVNDEEDKCIDIPGSKENKGCPQVDKEIEQKIDLAAKNIFFKTGSSQLLAKSFSSLDEVVDILIANKRLTLLIEGHTDNVGNEHANQVLSEKRAQSVLDYIVSKGIPRERLSSIGYGMQRPIADNANSQGRAHNRRVEMKVK